MNMAFVMKLIVFAVEILAATSAQEGYFWHVTDHHYDATYWSEMRSCNDLVPVRGIYGDYWCDSPWRLVKDSIAAMAVKRKNVDFILWTGDNVAHIKNKFLSTQANLEVLTNITNEMKSQFPGVTVYGTMGNHDWFPADQFPVHTAFLYNATWHLWREWIGTGQMDNFQKGGFYTTNTLNNLRIIALNTVLYYKPDKLTPELQDPAGQFQWFENVLSMARNASQKVIVIGHVPPGIKSPGTVQWMYNNFNTRLLDICRTYSDVIAAMHFGHDHADEMKLLYRHGRSPGVPVFMAPSVTPWRYKTSTETADPHNPAIRLVKYNRKTGLTLDIEQYYMDLTASNRRNSSAWLLAYSAARSYGVQDLSANSVDSIVKKMSQDGIYLNKYIRFNTVLANRNNTVINCDAKCRAEYICCITNHEMAEFNSCVKSETSGAAGASLVSFIILILSLATYA